jgi:hypothetical protein
LTYDAGQKLETEAPVDDGSGVHIELPVASAFVPTGHGEQLLEAKNEYEFVGQR